MESDYREDLVAEGTKESVRIKIDVIPYVEVNSGLEEDLRMRVVCFPIMAHTCVLEISSNSIICV